MVIFFVHRRSSCYPVEGAILAVGGFGCQITLVAKMAVSWQFGDHSLTLTLRKPLVFRGL
jgi:hypothetical protein